MTTHLRHGRFSFDGSAIYGKVRKTVYFFFYTILAVMTHFIFHAKSEFLCRNRIKPFHLSPEQPIFQPTSCVFLLDRWLTHDQSSASILLSGLEVGQFSGIPTVEY